MITNNDFYQDRPHGIIGPREKEGPWATATYTTTYMNKTVDIGTSNKISVQPLQNIPYTTYIDKHWALMLVDPRKTAQRAHALRRH